MSVRRLEVAAAVVLRDDGRFLLAQRPPGKVYAGYWEFPGGKIEDGESAEHALRRELHEELGIDVERAYPWITRDYDYAHAAVRLRFFRVVAWRGEPHGKEDQRFSWESAPAVTVSPLLPANGSVLRALALPPVYGISNAAALGMDPFLHRLERALKEGLRLFQIREKTLADEALLALATRSVALARRYGARVLINGDFMLAERLGADGVHVTATQLSQIATRPDFDIVGASCHDAAELGRAAEMGADLAVLGPVLATPTHPRTAGLGWDKFRVLVRNCPLPVYALGGMRLQDLDVAWRSGAHGVSMMRGAWDA
ncbi:MAG: Nudix family hydrolase [Betaproteobacteria bacterium]|nr:Nudix family hydrolase [Betaproteobacteria bacterium]